MNEAPLSPVTRHSPPNNPSCKVFVIFIFMHHVPNEVVGSYFAYGTGVLVGHSLFHLHFKEFSFGIDPFYGALFSANGSYR